MKTATVINTRALRWLMAREETAVAMMFETSFEPLVKSNSNATTIRINNNEPALSQLNSPSWRNSFQRFFVVTTANFSDQKTS
jgi:hypothetical protein